MTRRYRAVVRMLLCPISCWITGSATPSSSMWVAKATRRDLKETSGRWIPARSTARRNAAVLSDLYAKAMRLMPRVRSEKLG